MGLYRTLAVVAAVGISGCTQFDKTDLDSRRLDVEMRSNELECYMRMNLNKDVSQEDATFDVQRPQ